MPAYITFSTMARGATLFPYTTLFRSAWSRGHRVHGRLRSGKRRRRNRLARTARCDRAGVVRRSSRAGGTRLRADRKSTRLNSSHLVISYAVFCFKKKTKNKKVKVE